MIHIHTSKVKWLFSALFCLFFAASFGQDKVSMVFVGDVMQHDGQIQAAYNAKTKTYEYEDGFKYIKPLINEYDLRIANLEVTLAGEPFKGYPQFSAPDALAETLVTSGFNVILTSNNHSADRGQKGIIRTLDQLDALGVKHTGTFRSQAERDANYPLIVEQNNIKIAMLNYTYGTNGIEVSGPVIVNYIDSNVIRADVARAKALGAEYIVCNLHWGTEYKPLPNSYQKTYEALCYRLGVDMVIGGHPHVVQPIEKKTVGGKDKLTVWSLGNFVSNMQVRYTRGGVMVGATIEKKDKKITLQNVQHHLVYVLAKDEGAVTQYYILPEFDYNAHRPGFLSSVDLQRMNEFFSDARKLYADNNSGTTEHLVSPTSKIGKLYVRYLTQYYSVVVAKNQDDLLLKKNFAQYVHEHVDENGTGWILSGICQTAEQAKANLQFIKDCGFAEAKIALVEPNKVTPVTP